MFKLLCKCEKCLKLYNEKYVGFIATKEELIDDWNNRELLEDKLDEQANLDNEENKEIINKIDNFDFNLLPEVRNLPIEKVIKNLKSYSLFLIFLIIFILIANCFESNNE